MSRTSVLIIEDEPDIIEVLEYNLDREGFGVLSAQDGESGLRLAAKHRPDVILLDLMLPGVNGLEVCRRLKAEEGTQAIPIIMLTAKSEEIDIVMGLEMGADDYVTKPFSPRVVTARIRSLLRRIERLGEGVVSPRIELEGLVLDAERHEAHLGEELLSLTRSEFRLLWALCRRPGRVFTRDQLVEKITDGEAFIVDRNVDVHVSSIRRKLGEAGEMISTVRGVGYKCRD